MQPLPPPPPKGRPGPTPNPSTGQQGQAGSGNNSQMNRGNNATDDNTRHESVASATSGARRRKHRGGKKRKNRRQSFAAQSETSGIMSNLEHLPGDPLAEAPEDELSGEHPRPTDSFYIRRKNQSRESLDSDALLDHRTQSSMRPRRESKVNMSAAHRASLANTLGRQQSGHSPSNQNRRRRTYDGGDEDSDDEITDRTPLMGTSQYNTGYGGGQKHDTRASSRSSGGRRRTQSSTARSFPKYTDDVDYDVNNPPSVPASPHLASQFDDPMMPESDFLARSPSNTRNLRGLNGDAYIDIDGRNGTRSEEGSGPPSPRPGDLQRSRTVALPVEGDVCFPVDVMSEMADDDFDRTMSRGESRSTRRHKRKREWPQVWVLEEWSREEKEERAGERRAQKIREPVMIEGRLRPSRASVWHRPEDMPYRYTYFNEEFESTIHSQTISELVQPGSNFRELFIPDPPSLPDSSSESDEEEESLGERLQGSGILSPKEGVDAESTTTLGQPPPPASNIASRLNSTLSTAIVEGEVTKEFDGAKGNDATPTFDRAIPNSGMLGRKSKQKKYGPRPTFWLDVLCPTEQEMSVLRKAFGIHGLTTEDIMMQEAREKIELFKNYYFVNYRTFEQDPNSEDYLEAINMYVVVFREGILTFHFSPIPHPANVRRRIRQLTDYLILSSDWISYAIIDDITDVYQPLITDIEQEVDEIDELILTAFSGTGVQEKKNDDDSDAGTPGFSGIDMLRRVGGCRKKVMSLYRLLGNKADVIKGFAKRCNERWDVAPKSEIGLYLGDIQDHILTMTSNLSHYETLLSRAHSNYLAQVSIRMNERAEQTSDILSKLTVLGTIVLPMNIICGMWGMNVQVPGQDVENLWWFWGIAAGLVVFAVGCFLFCKRVYGIV